MLSAFFWRRFLNSILFKIHLGIDGTSDSARKYDRRVDGRIRAQNPKYRRFPDLESGAHGIDCFPRQNRIDF